MTELEEYHHQLIADIQGDADAMGLITVEAFFEKVGDLLTEAGEVDGANRAYFEGRFSRGTAQIDGYGGDPRDTDGVLSLILCDVQLSDDLRVVNVAHIQRLLQRLYRFVSASLKEDFRNGLEETSPGFGVADLIAVRWKAIEKIKLVIVTNGEFRTKRADGAFVKELEGKQVTLSVWDLKRLKQYEDQGQVRADLIINFKNDFGSGLPLLRASSEREIFESYLAVVPGTQLAAIYDKWGLRLLEANVRSFLQARGKVNQGIRNTIRNDPHMFFPYNNGLCATADSIEMQKSEDGLELVSAENFQIVNGGQTTASIHAAQKDFASKVENVHVQMKLTIVPRDKWEDVVPKISEYANSQNRVNAADFFSNHPFQVRVEELSRRILAPSGVNGFRETKWFYERARGQYADERGRRTLSERRKFDALYPRRQFVTKTDLAKFENTWGCKPYIVSLGAQKNFVSFAKDIGSKWGKSGSAFDEVWFKRTIAKAIVFRQTEKLVSAAEWYGGGYRANIVTYSIAKVVHDVAEGKHVIDLDTVWKLQDILPELRRAISIAGSEAQHVISNPPEGVRNFSEWAKKQACWQQLSYKRIKYPDVLECVLITPEIAEEAIRIGRTAKALHDGATAQIEVHRLGAQFWSLAHDWAKERHLLSYKELGVIDSCAAIPRRLPSERQCVIAMSALSKLRDLGFELHQTQT